MIFAMGRGSFSNSKASNRTNMFVLPTVFTWKVMDNFVMEFLSHTDSNISLLLIVSRILCLSLQDLPWCQFRKLVRVRGSYVRIGERRVRWSYVRIAGDGLNWTHGHILTRLLPQTTTSLLQAVSCRFLFPSQFNCLRIV